MPRLSLRSVLLLAFLLTTRAVLGSFTYTWIGGTSGDWETSTNWSSSPSGGTFPHSGDTALFSSVSGFTNVLLTSADAVNQLQFNYSTSTNVSFQQQALTFDNGGSIQFQSGLSSSARVVINNPLLINTNFTFTSSAGSGSGALELESAIGETTPGSTFTINAGNSTVAFSASSANTYTGATIVNSGLATLANSGVSIPGDLQILGSGRVTAESDNQISQNSNVTINSSNALNLSPTTQSTTINTLNFQAGSITPSSMSNVPLILASGTSALTMRGNTTLSMPLIFSSTTHNSDITYDATNVGTATISGSIDLGGVERTVILNHNAGNTIDMSVSGAIQNGGLTVQGATAGVLQLSGANTYSGDTNLVAGTIQAGVANTFSPNSNYTLSTSNATLKLNNQNQTIGLLSGSGSVSLGSATLTFGNGDSTFSGNISDGGSGGSLVKQGSGTFTYSGTASYTGTTTVTQGRLSVNGSLTSSGGVTVDGGATLGGTGPITGATTVSGTLSPGNSIGTINISPSVTLANNSTYQVEIDPTSSSLTNVTGSPGTFTIGSDVTLAVTMDPGVYSESKTYPIVTTTGGITFGSQFATITGSLPTVALTVSYTDFDVLLTETGLPFSNFFTSGNAGGVATCLDALSATSGSDLSLVLGELRQFSTLNELKEALELLQPSQFTALALAEENATLYTSEAIFERLQQEVRSCDRLDDKRQAFWLSPFGGFAHQSRTAGQVGFNTDTAGVATGYDFRPFADWIFGGALGYSYSHLKWKHGRGDADLQNGYAALYASGTGRYAYLFGALMGSYNHYSATRHIAFGEGLVTPIDRKARSSHNGGQGSAHLQGGFFFGEKVQFIPFAEADYIFVHEGSFTEHGAQSLDLHVKDKNSDVLEGEVGIEITRCYSVSRNKFSPVLALSAIREWRFIGKHIKSSFEDSSCVMRTTGMNPDRTLLSGVLGLTLLLPDENRTLSFFYQGKLGKNYQDNRLLAQLLYKF